MRFSLLWLKEFIEVSLPPETLAERLTMAGCEVKGFSKVDGDWIFEAEVTPNRPDLLSHYGIARETAAVLGRQLRMPRWLKKEIRPVPGKPPPLPITIEDETGCRRYVGIVIEGVRVGPSPPEIAERLNRFGIRPVNNVVDVTNLCLLELGQPLHAFDLDKLEGPAIRVRRAQPKETFIAIDGTTLTLTPEHLVIADSKRPVALAGVMGGRDTEIAPTTKRVLLESAWFAPERIRKSSRSARISSESSYRFERGVDPAMVPAAATRAARRICALAGGTIVGGSIDVGETRMAAPAISLRPRYAQEILGMRIYPAQQRRILERLECQVTVTARSWRVEPPSWRPDLRIPEDLFEELARLWGYERCPATLPPVMRRNVDSHWRPVEDPWLWKEAKIRQFLAAAGGQEIMTYSLLSEEILSRCQISSARKIQNPLSAEQAFLRPSFLPGVLEMVARNLHRKSAESFRLFELGRVFSADGDSKGTPPPDRAAVFERRALSLLMTGPKPSSWGEQTKPQDRFDLRGTILALLLGPLRLQEIQVATAGFGPDPNVAGDYYLKGTEILFLYSGKILGSAAPVDPKILEAFEIPNNPGVFYAELNLDLIAGITPAPLSVKSLPKVPPVIRDLAILVPDETSYEEIRQAIEAAGKPLLKEAHLFDLYKGKQVPAGEKSLAFRLTYSAGDRTLTDEEVAAAHQKVVSSLQNQFNATLR